MSMISEQGLRGTILPTLDDAGPLHQLLAEGGVGLLLVSPDFRVLDANAAWCAMSGYSRERLRGMAIADLTHPEDLEDTFRHIRSYAGEETSRGAEKRYRRADGSAFWARIRTRVLPDAEGKELYGLVMAVDITPEKENEQSLLQATQQARIIADNVPAYISYVDTDLRYQFVNLNYEKLYCRKREEILGRRIPDLLAPPTWENARPHFERALKGERVGYEGLFDNARPDERHSLVQLVPQREGEGPVQGIFILVTNITAMKDAQRLLQEASESSQQLAAIVEASNDAIFRTRMDGVVEFWSKGAERLYGYKAEEIVGNTVHLLVDKGDPGVRERIVTRVSNRESVVFPDAVRVHKDGHKVEVSIAIFPIYMEGGEVIGAASVHREIGELKQLQAQLRHSQRLETAGQLAGGIAHDFNNILTVVQGYASVIAEQLPAGSPLAEQFTAIERAGQRAAVLTRKLLTFSRRQQIETRVLNPVDVIRDVSGMLHRTLGEDIQLRTELTSTWSVREDPTQLEQIVLNLSINARHAMPEGGLLRIETTDVSLGEDAPQAKGMAHFYSPDTLLPGDYVLLAVSDTGEGMSREVLERIFEPFFTTRPQGEGTGLGLSVVYGIVTQGGGTIQVETEQGRGTRFKVYLPRAEGPLAAGKKPVDPAPAGRETVLVVEDNADVLKLIGFILKSAGYTVLTAGTPVQALEKQFDCSIDLLISDVLMPGMNGPELVERWLERHPDTPYLFVSGYTDGRTQALAHDPQKVLQKPFTPQDLLSRVRQVLHG